MGLPITLVWLCIRDPSPDRDLLFERLTVFKWRVPISSSENRNHAAKPAGADVYQLTGAIAFCSNLSDMTSQERQVLKKDHRNDRQNGERGGTPGRSHQPIAGEFHR